MEPVLERLPSRDVEKSAQNDFLSRHLGAREGEHRPHRRSVRALHPDFQVGDETVALQAFQDFDALFGVVVEVDRVAVLDLVGTEPDHIRQVLVGVENLAVPETRNNVGDGDRLHQLEELRFRFALPFLEPRELDGLMDADLHLVDTHRLDEEALRALDDGLHRDRDRGMGGEENEGNFRPDAQYPSKDLEPVHTGHVEIAKDDGVVLGKE